MQKPDFSLLQNTENPPAYVRHWLLLAVATLAVSGLGPLVLLAGRGSMLAEHETVKSLFYEALVVHVDLSVLAWFLGISLLFWAMLARARPERIPTLRGASLACFGLGCLGVALAPLISDGTALMSNYIPVHTSPLFFLGLSLLLAAVILGLMDIPLLPRTAQQEGIIGSAYITLLAILHFGWGYARVEALGMAQGTQEYYEIMFWAGGHLLQLAITQLLLVAWLWLASAAKLELNIKPVWLLLIFAIYPLIATASPIAFLDGSTPYNLHFFTQQMRHGGGLAAIVLGLYLGFKLVQHGKPARDALLPWTCLVISMLVFATGGLIGYMIGDSNTIIPAHYHGSIVGCTVAFMGVIYRLLPAVGYRSPNTWKLALWQPWLYGGGSVIHAVGFAIAGGHGAARKTVGAMEGVPEAADHAMQLARLGGALAVIGGALFVVVVIRAMRKK